MPSPFFGNAVLGRGSGDGLAAARCAAAIVLTAAEPTQIAGEFVQQILRVLRDVGEDDVARLFHVGACLGIAHPVRLRLGRHQPGEEQIGDDHQKRAARYAEDQPQRAVDGADPAIQDEIGQPHGEEGNDDQHDKERAGDQHDIGQPVGLNELPRLFAHVEIGPARRTEGDDPRQDRQHLTGEAAHHGQNAGQDDDDEQDHIEQGERARTWWLLRWNRFLLSPQTPCRRGFCRILCIPPARVSPTAAFQSPPWLAASDSSATNAARSSMRWRVRRVAISLSPASEAGS